MFWYVLVREGMGRKAVGRGRDRTVMRGYVPGQTDRAYERGRLRGHWGGVD